MKFKKMFAVLGTVLFFASTVPAAHADYTINLGPKQCSPGEFVGSYVTTYSPYVLHGFTAKNG